MWWQWRTGLIILFTGVLTSHLFQCLRASILANSQSNALNSIIKTIPGIDPNLCPTEWWNKPFTTRIHSAQTLCHNPKPWSRVLQEGSTRPCTRVGILYTPWHWPAWNAQRVVASKNKPVLNIEQVLNSRHELGSPPPSKETYSSLSNRKHCLSDTETYL